MRAVVPDDVLDGALTEEVTTLANAIERICAGHTSEAVHIALAMVFGAGLALEDRPDAVVAGFAPVAAAEAATRRRAS